MAWGDHARTDYAADKAVRTGRVSYLVERDRRLYGRPIFVSASGSTSSASYADLATLTDVPLPVYVANTVDTVKLKLRVQGRIAAGTGNLRVNVGADTGTDSTNITSASYVDVDIECTVSNQTPGDVDIVFQGKSTSGLLEFTVDGFLAWFEVA